MGNWRKTHEPNASWSEFAYILPCRFPAPASRQGNGCPAATSGGRAHAGVDLARIVSKQLDGLAAHLRRAAWRSPMMTSQERAFHSQALTDVQVAETHGYTPSIFKRMIANDPHGAAGATRHLLGAPRSQTGLWRLWELGLVRISVEQRVIEAPVGLFTAEEVEEARRRLAALAAGSTGRERR